MPATRSSPAGLRPAVDPGEQVAVGRRELGGGERAVADVADGPLHEQVAAAVGEDLAA